MLCKKDSLDHRLRGLLDKAFHALASGKHVLLAEEAGAARDILCAVLAKRVVAPNSTLANVVIVAKVKSIQVQKLNDLGQPVFILDGVETLDPVGATAVMVSASETKWDVASITGAKTIDEIIVGNRKRPLDASKVTSMAYSMNTIGLLSPVIIDSNKNLIAGLHRLEAAKALGWEFIDYSMSNPRLIEDLNKSLANSIEFYSRAHGMHWNVEGMFFPVYHKFFAKIYEEVYGAIDTFAEEIRACGGYVGYGTAFVSKTNMIPETKQIMGNDVAEMITELQMSNAIVLKSLNSCFQLAENAKNQGLMDFLAARIDAHSKHGWMIDSCLKK
jgi:starvation-inducible DNA-binding protein